MILRKNKVKSKCLMSIRGKAKIKENDEQRSRVQRDSTQYQKHEDYERLR